MINGSPQQGDSQRSVVPNGPVSRITGRNAVHVETWPWDETIISIVNGGITSDMIADGAITTAKIANGAVTNAKLGDDVGMAPNVADSVIGQNHLSFTINAPIIIKITADQSFPGAVANIVGLSTSLIAGHYYRIAGCLIGSVSGALVGLTLGLTCPASSILSLMINGIKNADGTAAAFQGCLTASGDTVGIGTLLGFGIDLPYEVSGVIKPTADGILQLQAGCTGVGSATIRPGSHLLIWDLGT